MKKQQRGIILLTTVMVLSLIMLLLLAQTELIMTHYKILNQFTKQDQQLEYLERLAMQLIAEQKDRRWQSSCLTKELDPNKAINLLKAQQIGCVVTDQELTYRYLIENLGQFKCLTVNVDGINYSTEHWRLTFITLDSPWFILQVRFTSLAPFKKGDCRQICKSSLGILSWRFLIS